MHAVRGDAAVLGVDAAHVLAEHLERVDRVAAPVHEQIRRIEVDAEIAQADRLDVAQQRDGRLLPGLEPEADAELVAMARHLVDRDAERLEAFIRHVLREEAAVGDDGRRAHLHGEIRPALERLDAGPAEFGGHEPEGDGASAEIPVRRAGHARPERRDPHALVGGALAHRMGDIRFAERHIPADDLAAAQAEIGYDVKARAVL